MSNTLLPSVSEIASRLRQISFSLSVYSFALEEFHAELRRLADAMRRRCLKEVP